MYKTLTFYEPDIKGNVRYGATYYIEADCHPVGIRMYAETASTEGDVKVNIFDDGTSIFANSPFVTFTAPTKKGATQTLGDDTNYATLIEGDNLEPHAGDFIGDTIESGSLVHCEIVDTGNCKNLSVHLEIERLTEEMDEEDSG